MRRKPTAWLQWQWWLRKRVYRKCNISTTNKHRRARLLKQQTSITVYRLPTKENKQKFAVSGFRIYIHWNGSIYIYIYINMCISIYTVYKLPSQLENGKRKPRRFSFICLPFAHRANRSLLFVCLFTRNKQKLSIYWLNGLNGLNGLAHLCE